jgi:chemotaxis protein MotD
MTGPGAIMPNAPSLPSLSGAKIENAANAVEVDTAESGTFYELFEALKGEVDEPEQDLDALRDESAGLLPLPFPIQMFPEKTPQSRFAEELSATLPLGFANGLASEPPRVEAELSGQIEAPKAVSPPAPPIGGAPPVQPLVGRAPQAPPAGSDVAAAISSALPGAPPEPKPASPSVLPVSAPAIPAGGPQERNVAKALPQESSAVGEPTAAPAPLAAPAEAATSENRSGQDGERGETARNLAALKEAKVSIIHQETHFAPAPAQSLAFQIANRIVHEIGTADPVFTASVAAVPDDASAAPVKALFIQLDPPELGALTIRMSLKDETLHLQIEASRHETARLIERDRDALSGMLRSAGYNFDGLTVQITTGDRGNGAQQFSGGSGFNQPAGQHAAGRQPEDSGSGQGWQRAGEPERIAENGRDTEAPGAPGRRGGLVYL